MKKVVECGAGCVEIRNNVRLEQGQPTATGERKRLRERIMHTVQRNSDEIAQEVLVSISFVFRLMLFRSAERHLPVKEQDTVPMDNVLGDLPIAKENCGLCIFQKPELNMRVKD